MIFRKIRYILSGILFGILAWFVEALLHTLIFHIDENVYTSFFYPDIHEIWMRSVFLAFFLFLGFYAQIVSERKLKESDIKFQKSEAKYYSFINNFNGIAFQGYNDLTYGFFDGAVEKLTGYKEEEFASGQLKWDQIIYHKDRVGYHDTIEKFHTNSVNTDKRKYRIVRKDGKICWVLEQVQKIYNDAGKEVDIQGTIHDITKHKQVKNQKKKAEEVLNKKEHDLRERVKELTCLYKLSNIDNADKQISLRQLFIETLKLIPPAWQFPDVTCARIAYKGSEYKTKNFSKTNLKQKAYIKEKNEVVGKVEVYYLKNMPKFDEGPFVKEERYLIDSIAEILGKYIEHTQAEQELKESEALLQKAEEIARIGTWKLNPLTEKVILSKEMFDIFQIKPEDFNGSLDVAIAKIHPDDRHTTITISEAIKEKKSYELEYRIIHTDGTIINVLALGDVVRNNEGEVVEIIGTVQDITEKKKAERIVLQEIKKLKELNNLKDDLITRISHELKTPLTAICGASQMLLNHLQNNDEVNIFRYADIINKGGERLKNFAKDLIECSEIESNELKLRLSRENLAEIVKEVVEDIIYIANERGIFLNVKFHDKFHLDIDRFRIQQVISNLISNAIKNTPRNGMVYIDLQENGDHVDLLIKDNGVGLTSGEKKLLFKKFGKIERYGKSLDVDIEGSGLGLYISKKIVKFHGGQILVESEGRNKGSIFTIRLPKIPQES